LGTITTVENSDGSKSLTVDILKNGISQQLADSKLDNVTLDLSDLKLDTYKNLSVTMAKNLAEELTKAGKGVVLTNGAFSLNIPVESFADFINEDGFALMLSVSNEGTLQKAQTESKMVSQVISIQNKTGKLTKAITLSIQPDTKLAGDARKQGIYQLQEDGTWAYVGSSSKNSKGESVLATTKLGTYAVMEYHTTFTDVTKNWAKDEIEVIASHHLIKGKSAGKFAPNDTITRAQFAVILDRIVGSEKAWSEYAKISGANKPLTREEMVTMIVEKLEVDLSTVEGELTFNDQDMISKEAKAAVLFAVQNGLIKGVNGNFVPEQTATRAQASVVIYRLMVYLGRL
jgi:minor extracellular serine protease Vpr